MKRKVFFALVGLTVIGALAALWIERASAGWNGTAWGWFQHIFYNTIWHNSEVIVTDETDSTRVAASNIRAISVLADTLDGRNLSEPYAKDGLRLGTSSATTAGVMRWSGTNFEGYTGSEWVPLDVQTTSGGGWTDDGTTVRTTTGTDSVAIGTSTASELLTVAGTAHFDSSIYQGAFPDDAGLVLSLDFSEPVGSEELTDGGFETWASSTDLSNWTEDGVSAGIRDITKDSTVVKAGSYSVKLTAAGSDGTTDFGIYQDITTESGKTYQFNGWVRTDSLTQGEVRLEAYDLTNSVSLASQTYSTQSSEWKWLSLRFTSTNTTSVQIRLYFNDETDGYVYLDAFSVKKVFATVYDQSPYANDGTVYGASVEEAEFGQVLRFDGEDDYGTASFTSPNRYGTVEVWVKGQGSALEFSYSSYVPGSYAIQIDDQAAGNCTFRIIYDDGTYTTMSPTNISAWSANSWNLIHFTRDNLTAYVYVNGEFIDDCTLEDKNAVASSNFALGVTRLTASKTNYLDGFIASVRIYNRALSEAEIRAHYLRGLRRFSTVIADEFKVVDTDGDVNYRMGENFRFRTTSTGGGSGVFVMGNASTVPTGTLSDAAGLYASGGELYAYDSAGNATLLSPHDPVTGHWIFYSVNVKTGQVVKIDMEEAIRALEMLTGKKLMTVSSIPDSAWEIKEWEETKLDTVWYQGPIGKLQAKLRSFSDPSIRYDPQRDEYFRVERRKVRRTKKCLKMGVW